MRPRLSRDGHNCCTRVCRSRYRRFTIALHALSTNDVATAAMYDINTQIYNNICIHAIDVRSIPLHV